MEGADTIIVMNSTVIVENSSIEKLIDENAKLKKENERLGAIVRQANADWERLRDFIRAESPTEMIRFVDAAKEKKGVEIFLAYISALWSEMEG